jgi:hypothetical protein
MQLQTRRFTLPSPNPLCRHRQARGALRNLDPLRLLLRLHLLVRQQEIDRGPCQPAISPLRISAFPSPHHAARPPAPVVLRPVEPVQTRKEGSEERVGQTIFMTRIATIACDTLVWPSHTHHRAPHGPLCLLLRYQHFSPLGLHLRSDESRCDDAADRARVVKTPESEAPVSSTTLCTHQRSDGPSSGGYR